MRCSWDVEVRIGGDLEWCRDKRVGIVNDPTLMAWADDLFQVGFSYVLLDAA